MQRMASGADLSWTSPAVKEETSATLPIKVETIGSIDVSYAYGTDYIEFYDDGACGACCGSLNTMNKEEVRRLRNLLDEFLDDDK